MDMDIAGLAEQRIFEVMMFQIGDAVRHIGLARQKRFFPQNRAVADDPAGAAHIRGEFAEQQLRPQRRLP